MTYNAENLFDTVHDPGKHDYTWLPLEFKKKSPEVQAYCAQMRSDYYRKSCQELDWTDAVLTGKAKNLAKAITSYSYNNLGPDIVVLEEVENINALKALVRIGMPYQNYQYITLLEGPDTRGIDIGVISRFPILEQKYHQIDLSQTQSAGKLTRGVFEVKIKVGMKTVTVLGNHWPSQGNTDDARLKASMVMLEAARKAKSNLIIATGDFNTLEDDFPHGIRTNVLPYFEDVEVRARQLTQQHPGTHWYRGKWSSLDKIFVYKPSLRNDKSIVVDHSSFKIVNSSFLVQDLTWTDFDTGMTYFDKEIPKRFNPKDLTGYSDHLPVAIRIDL